MPVSKLQANFSKVFFKVLGKPLAQSVLLREHSHFQIGGPADCFFEASSVSDLERSVCLARENSVPFYIIGGGYNILFSDEGFRGLIIKNCTKGIEKGQSGEIEVLSGTYLQDLVQFCLKEGISGMEFLAGIPGTVGGAVFGNAGAFDQNIGSLLLNASLLNKKGKVMTVDRDYFAFGYRTSLLKEEHSLLLKSAFVAAEKDRKEIRAKVEENLIKRKRKHPPWDIPCAGSYFKNPALPTGEKVPAARLLEDVGAKDLIFGDAAVFKGHANFIINRGNASAQDVIRLAAELKQRVKEKFGVELKEEVIFLPAGFSMP